MVLKKMNLNFFENIKILMCVYLNFFALALQILYRSGITDLYKIEYR